MTAIESPATDLHTRSRGNPSREGAMARVYNPCGDLVGAARGLPACSLVTPDPRTMDLARKYLLGCWLCRFRQAAVLPSRKPVNISCHSLPINGQGACKEVAFAWRWLIVRRNGSK